MWSMVGNQLQEHLRKEKNDYNIWKKFAVTVKFNWLIWLPLYGLRIMPFPISIKKYHMLYTCILTATKNLL